MYCSDTCQKKYWKLTHRDKYLIGKKRYRKKNKEKILEYNRIYKRVSKSSPSKQRKEEIIKSRGGVCEKCKGKERLNVHHIKPRWLGGTNREDNLLVLCWDCHMIWEKLFKSFWGKSNVRQKNKRFLAKSY